MLILCLLCFTTTISFSQKPISILVNSNSAGKNYLTGSDIMATEIIFPTRIYNYSLDTNARRLTVQLRGTQLNQKILKGTGKLVMLDLTGYSQKWNININYLKSRILQYDDVIIRVKTNNESSRLNTENGKKLWSIYKEIFYIDSYTGIGIGYPLTSPGYTEMLEGYDLTDGRLKWYRQSEPGVWMERPAAFE